MLLAILDRLKKHQRALSTLFLGVLLPLLGFGQLAAAVHYGGGLAIDREILFWIGTKTNPAMDAWVAEVTRLGYLFAIPGLAAVALSIRWILGHPRGAAFFVATAVGSYGLNVLTKWFFHRTRPALWTSASPESSYSFPSGHAMMSMSVAIALVILLWPTRWRFLVLGSAPCVLFISLSRLYLGVHYPSDILAGWFAGTLWTTGTWAILMRKADGDSG